MRADLQPLAAITTILTRGISPRYTDADGFLVLNQRCIREYRASLTEARMTSKETPIPVHKRVRTGDVLINSTGTGTVGRTAIVRTADDAELLTADSHITIVRADEVSV